MYTFSRYNAYNTHTHARTHARTHTHRHSHALVSQGNGTEEMVFEKSNVLEKDLEELTEAE